MEINCQRAASVAGAIVWSAPFVLPTKLGWSTMLTEMKRRIRERLVLVRSCRISGTTSVALRSVLFSSFVKPLFAWLYCLTPLMTSRQSDDLDHFYLSCLRKIEGNLAWIDVQFLVYHKVEPFEDFCHRYWSKYKTFLGNSDDGCLLYELFRWNVYRRLWLNIEIIVSKLYRSKRSVPFSPTIERGLEWLESSGEDSTLDIPLIYLELLKSFSTSFL